MEFGFTIQFLLTLGKLVLSFSPIIAFLILVISMLAITIGKREGWTLADSLYFGFITASTVGYGDFRPSQRRGKWLAIVIALCGLILTGIVVALAVESAAEAYRVLNAREVTEVIGSH
ncbi:MAG: potassium channel family protein [Acidiferrobacterales bacterium]|jgi:membrane-associated PAP2 superfamily phosphatase|nr:potassium channel family protein [Acidiferrobacterales bacterium]